VLFGIRRFQYFLHGRQFVVKTNHQALCYIDSVDHRNAKLARWMAYQAGVQRRQYLRRLDLLQSYLPKESHAHSSAADGQPHCRRFPAFSDHTFAMRSSLYCENCESEANSLRRKLKSVRFAFASRKFS